ncbi:MAG TPA: serine/threonine-protein kinase [Pyrinomonadaceae bacterium]|nr:serine/threonine-protein kinase [Pyrinomonadaceae bacterium]
MRDEDVTRKLETPKSSSSRASSFESIDDARFVSGTILADRYRIVGLLGRGGMGEVYRADDLKLSQPVALKFLPDRYLSDGAALARFHREVRVARQVSHKNVCRVYDIGEIDGRHYLSMEFIKGEELSSLLRRIGRLPTDKALQIARQICAGLSAAHDSGILHRDLKPANIMIDADGNARITDFGLAGLAEEIREDEMAAGTPAYMAPEQLDGGAPTVRSDIYSLGLVLYELFTGKRAFDAPTLGELIRLRRSDSTPTNPTAIVKDLDPVIERVIDRCLQKDPAERPASALQVAAALPGGDPIAAALAAGETPSPEMVAAAPKAGALRPAAAIASLAGVIALLLFHLFSSYYARAERNVPLEKPPEVLAERARDIISSLGYENRPVDQAYGFTVDGSFYRHLQTTSYDQWKLMRAGQPLTVYFWYRQAPRYLIADGSLVVTPDNPALDVAGMTNIALDPKGRLVRFDRVPPQVAPPSDIRKSTEWAPLFAAAGLPMDKYLVTEPTWVPSMFADERAAWQGPHVDHPEIPVRIEAASFQGQVVHFAVVFPWDIPTRQEEETFTSGERFAAIVLCVVFVAVVIGAGLMGRNNLKLGRGDTRGASRLAMFIFLVSAVGGLIGAHHVPVLGDEIDIIFMLVAYAITPAALTWLLYIALEPSIRRRWPRLIISWSRLMAGSFRDPMVGRDLLIGGMLGLFHSAFIALGALLPRLFGMETPPTVPGNVFILGSVRTMLAAFLGSHVAMSVFTGFGFLFFLLLLYIILRKQWLAIAAMFLITLLIELSAFAAAGPWLFWVVSTFITLTIVTVVARFGLLATMAHQLFFFLTLMYPMTTDFSVWYAPSMVFALALVVGIAVYGFYISLGGQSPFGNRLLHED